MDANEKPTVAPTATVSEKRSAKKLWIKILGGIACALIVLILALPTILGSKWIYEPIIQRLAKDQFKLEIGAVKLSWLNPLEFNDIRISQTFDGMVTTEIPPLVTIPKIKSNRGMLAYLLTGRNLGLIEIIEPKLDIALLEDGANLERLVRSIAGTPGNEGTQAKSKPKLDLDLAVRRLSVQIEQMEGGKTIQFIPPIDADISYRALNQDPMLVIQPMKVLDQEVLTPELIKLGVGLAVPLLAKSAWFDGRISLSTKEIRVPLAKPAESTGEATLTLHQVRSGPTEPLIVGALDALARLQGKEAFQELVFVDGSQILVQVAEGRVFHTGLEAGLPRLDPRLQIATQGYVGLVDRSLDLSVEIPVPIEQLARREKVQQLGVPRVKLPVGGTLDNPEIKWDVMRGESALLLSAIAGRLQSDSPLTSTIVEAIGEVTDGKADDAIATAVDFVKNLRQRRAQEKSERAEEVLPPNEAKEPEKRRPFRDALKNVFK